MFFKDDAAVDDYVFFRGVKIGDTAGDLLADQGFELGGIAGAAAAGRHEGAYANVNAGATLDDGGDGAGNGKLLLKGSLKRGPVSGLRDFETRKLVVAFLVAASDGNFACLAGLNLGGIVVECAARQHSFDLVAHVEEDLVGRE